MYDSSMLNDKPILNLIKETNRILRQATDKGLSDNQPPQEMINSLHDDIFVFSACKTQIQLKELGSYLVDPDGKVASWSSFRKSALAIHDTYNVNYLEAEYIFATSSAQMAAKWADVSKDQDRYNLQYRTAKDDRVRNSHRIMDGTTLPASDAFWNSYYPPNGWRCRCTAVQVIKGKYPESNSQEMIQKADQATTEIDSQGRDRNAMFRFNPGKQKVIFPPRHPYYKVQNLPFVQQLINQTPVSASDAINNRIDNATNLKEIAKELQDHMRASGQPDFVSKLSGISVEIAKVYAKELINLVNTYEIDYNWIEFNTRKKNGYYGAVETISQIDWSTRKEIIRRKMNVSGEIDKDRLSDTAIKKSLCDKNKIQLSTLTHEFGHMLWRGGTEITPRLKVIGAKIRHINTLYYEERSKLPSGSAEYDAIYLGNYADTNINEFFAEAFEEYICKSNPSKYAVMVGEVVNSFLKKNP